MRTRSSPFTRQHLLFAALTLVVLWWTFADRAVPILRAAPPSQSVAADETLHQVKSLFQDGFDELKTTLRTELVQVQTQLKELSGRVEQVEKVVKSSNIPGQMSSLPAAVMERKRGGSEKDSGFVAEEPLPPFLYELKDPRPLSEATPLVPNPSLWLYPEDQRSILPGDINGPWYSQVAQDRMLYTGFFRNHRNGTFVELGAVDGVTFSNSKFFQDSMEWDGLLIEPSEDFAFLMEGRSKYKRGNPITGKRCAPDGKAKCVNSAVCKREGNLTFVFHHRGDGNMVAGAVDYLTPGHAKFFRLNKNNTYQVRCRPFGTLLNEANVKHIDFLSLDVEGAEETVLETMDWSIPVHVIVIEALPANSPTGPEGHERKHRILMENGFEFLMFHKFDEWWVNPKHSRVKP